MLRMRSVGSTILVDEDGGVGTCVGVARGSKDGGIGDCLGVPRGSKDYVCTVPVVCIVLAEAQAQACPAVESEAKCCETANYWDHRA